MIANPPLWGFSILLAGIIAIARFKKIGKLYLPFIFCIWIGCINEILSYILVVNGLHSAVNNNIYVLAEALLLLVFFKNTGLFQKAPALFKIFFAGLVLLWLWENGIEGKITHVSSWFRITSSFLMVLISLAVISKLVLFDINRPFEMQKVSMFTSPVFLICLGTIVFFTFKLSVEIFWVYGLNHSAGFRIKLYHILIYFNLIVNGVYALAILWMLPKQQYIMR